MKSAVNFNGHVKYGPHILMGYPAFLMD